MNRYAEDEPKVVVPAVDMGVTIAIGSDRYPATIIEVKTPKKIVVQEDTVIARSQVIYNENQKYTYFPDPFGEKSTWTLRKDGAWRKQNSETNSGYRLFLSGRSQYRDPSY